MVEGKNWLNWLRKTRTIKSNSTKAVRNYKKYTNIESFSKRRIKSMNILQLYSWKILVFYVCGGGGDYRVAMLP